MMSLTKTPQSNVTPVFLAVLGFFVYYGLFAAFDGIGKGIHGFAEHDSSTKLDTLRAFAGVWKLGIFGVTMWRVGDAARRNRKGYLLVGAAFAICGSASLLAFANTLAEPLLFLFLVQAIEAIGEAFICAGLVAHVREETTGDDWRYFRTTTALRVGQNCGMVLALYNARLWNTHPDLYPMVLLGLRVSAALLLISLVRRPVVCNYSREHVTRRRCAITLNRLFFDVVVGACSYALFYLVAIGPSAIFDKKQYEMSQAFSLNGVFAVIAMVVIYLLAKKIHDRLSAENVLLKLEIHSVIGAIVVIAAWMVLFWQSSISNKTDFLVASTGVLGLFTTSTYVLSELSSGLFGKTRHQAAQIVSFFGLSRLGPILALALIFLSKQVHEAQWLPPWTAVLIVEVSVALGGAGIVLGVVRKWKLDSKGGSREYV